MAFKLAERVEETSTTTGIGTLNLAGATTNNRTFVAGIGTGNTTKFIIKASDGSWERSSGTVTDASPDTLSRTLIESSTGALLDLPAGTHTITCDWSAQDAMSSYEARQTYIRGGCVTKTIAANTIDISACACYDPSSGKIITYAGATGVSVGTLNTANPQWNQVYLYDNAGTVTPEVVMNAAPPSTAYAGTARQGGTNNNRRWIGSFLSNNNASGNIVPQDCKETGNGQFEITWLTARGSTPFRPLSAGSSTTFAAVSLVGCVPRYVASEANGMMLGTLVTTALDNLTMIFSIDGTNDSSYYAAYVFGTSQFIGSSMWVPIEAATPQIYYKVGTGGVGSGPRGYFDVFGYRAAR